jgi:hypothetical protein
MLEIAIRSPIEIRDRDSDYLDFDPKRTAIGGRTENRVETIFNSTLVQTVWDPNDHEKLSMYWQDTVRA